ncbi:nucleotide-sugar transporter-domain-containing protein [Crucibulum laeve]|uniref:Nucleotide-sugar transporter-domain-containing protein n=1 Tax=Crucibulum laeve TaxID=68775 RepID=A0A5C3LTS8_9AGAR|nr:nucleotide-sugar transporter-domain-containing protein [Crucibulum laeve]
MARPHPRVSAVNLSASSGPSSPDSIHHRPLPTVRSSSSLAPSAVSSKASSPRLSPLLPSSVPSYDYEKTLPTAVNGALQHLETQSQPTIFGMPLKYVSLVTLAVQNAALSIVMHQSRVSTPPSLAYSPASAVLLNEILKGSISFVIALARAAPQSDYPRHRSSILNTLQTFPYPWTPTFWSLCREILSPDCWKLSIPALLYVVQNSLQFVAISNLPVASFQVTYQMKILTTAAFSVALLRKKLTSTKWLSLFFLAIGVGIVQIQTSGVVPSTKPVAVGSAHEYHHVHEMNPLKGFGAVTAACFTSGLAGVYFEMVLKGSKQDLWVRNVQLSLFSLIPALLPVLYSSSPPNSQGFFLDLFHNFGGWAWGTVGIQVFGGLVTAIVIKYSDNILKGFATSLSIVLSFLASVALFNFRITPSFVIGASTVLAATWMYNQPEGSEPRIVLTNLSGKSTPYPGSPVHPDSPILGEYPLKKKVSPFGSPRALASSLGLGGGGGDAHVVDGYFSEMLDTGRYNSAPYGSPFNSRPPSRVPSRIPSRAATPSPRGSESGSPLEERF